MSDRFTQTRALLLAAAATLLAATSAIAADFPEKPVTFLVPFPPGGGADVLARVTAKQLSEKWKQPVVVENRPGAGGLLGLGVGAQAPADGYTLILTTAGTTLLYAQAKETGFDLIKDFQAVSLLAKSPMMIVARKDFPAENLAQLTELAKKTPGKLNYGGTGQGGVGNLAGELLRKRLGLDLVYIPYNGAGPTVTALLGNEIPFVILDPGGTLPQIKAGTLKALSVLSGTRFPLLPDVRSLPEDGIDDIQLDASYGVVVPKGTPDDIVKRISEGFSEALKSEEVKERLLTAGLEGVGSTPSDYATFLTREYEGFYKAVRTVGFVTD